MGECINESVRVCMRALMRMCVYVCACAYMCVHARARTRTCDRAEPAAAARASTRQNMAIFDDKNDTILQQLLTPTTYPGVCDGGQTTPVDPEGPF